MTYFPLVGSYPIPRSHLPSFSILHQKHSHKTATKRDLTPRSCNATSSGKCYATHMCCA